MISLVMLARVCFEEQRVINMSQKEGMQNSWHHVVEDYKLYNLK